MPPASLIASMNGIAASTTLMPLAAKPMSASGPKSMPTMAKFRVSSVRPSASSALAVPSTHSPDTRRPLSSTVTGLSTAASVVSVASAVVSVLSAVVSVASAVVSVTVSAVVVSVSSSSSSSPHAIAMLVSATPSARTFQPRAQPPPRPPGLMRIQFPPRARDLSRNIILRIKFNVQPSKLTV